MRNTKDAIPTLNIPSTSKIVCLTTDATTSWTNTLEAMSQAVYVESTLGVGTVYLPNVAEAVGCVISITALVGNTNAVAVEDQDESYDWADLDLNAAADGAVLMSDGRKWWVIADDYT